MAEPAYLACPADPAALTVLGVAVAGCAQPDLAADLLDEAAQRRPRARHPAHDAIDMLSSAGRHAAVEAYLEAAMQIAPDDPRLLEAAGGWLQRTDRGHLAWPVLERAIAIDAGRASAHVSMAALEAEAGRIGAAMARLERLIAGGQGGAAALGNLAVMLSIEGRADEAVGRFDAARRLDPGNVQLAVNHGMALLKAGRLAEGWPLFNRRLVQPGQLLLPPDRLLPIGAPLAGRTILVVHDSGLGDTIQFARFVPLLAEAGARVLLWVPRSLHRLLSSLPGVALLFSDDRAWPAHHWHCPIMRLAEALGATLTTIPPAPYLRADPAMVEHWSARLPPGRRIGVVWAGSTREAQPELAGAGRRRNIDPALLAPLLARRDVRWISLQAGALPPPGVFDPMPDVRDFADTAAIIAGLDAVVSVDTSVAHLAGALGCPVALLDRYENCWRWLHGQETSPWYPSLRILRQARWGDWPGVVQRIAPALSLGALSLPG